MQSGTLTTATCVMSDVQMTGMEGIELQRRIRLERPKLAVIFISAHSGAEIGQSPLDGGAVNFLHKPFDAANLLEVIHTAVTNAREK